MRLPDGVLECASRLEVLAVAVLCVDDEVADLLRSQSYERGGMLVIYLEWRPRELHHAGRFLRNVLRDVCADGVDHAVELVKVADLGAPDQVSAALSAIGEIDDVLRAD